MNRGNSPTCRIHLAMLGYHIVNDSCYNPRDLSSIMKDVVDDSVYDAAVERMTARRRRRSAEEEEDSGDCRLRRAEMSEAEWIADVSRSHGTYEHCINCELEKSNFFREAFRFQDRSERPAPASASPC